MKRRESWPHSAEACVERERQFGETWSEVLKESSVKVGVACPAFFCSHDSELKGLCHGDDLCVVGRRKQLTTFGRILQKQFEVKKLATLDLVQVTSAE